MKPEPVLPRISINDQRRSAHARSRIKTHYPDGIDLHALQQYVIIECDVLGVGYIKKFKYGIRWIEGALSPRSRKPIFFLIRYFMVPPEDRKSKRRRRNGIEKLVVSNGVENYNTYGDITSFADADIEIFQKAIGNIT